MGKLSVALSVGATGSVASVGGAYMLGAFGNGNLDIPTSLGEFKKKDGWSVVSNYFPNVLMGTGDQVNEGENGGTSNPADNFLGTDKTKGEGRLVVNGEKFDCSSDKSKKIGSIRGLGTFVNGDQGLALYASAKSNSDADSKLDVEGVIYALKKEQGEWKIKYNKPSSTTTQISNFSDSTFPKAGDKFTKADGLKVKEYWGFTSETDKLTKLCQSGSNFDGKKEAKEKFKGSWIGKPQGNGDHNPLNGSKTGHAGLTTFYGTTPNPTLETLLSGFATGAGTEEYFVNKSLGVTETQS